MILCFNLVTIFCCCCCFICSVQKQWVESEGHKVHWMEVWAGSSSWAPSCSSLSWWEFITCLDYCTSICCMNLGRAWQQQVRGLKKLDSAIPRFPHFSCPSTLPTESKLSKCMPLWNFAKFPKLNYEQYRSRLWIKNKSIELFKLEDFSEIISTSQQ